MAAKLPQCVGQSMFGGPARSAEQIGRTARPYGDQPEAAVCRGAENGIVATEQTEGSLNVHRPGVGNVAADQRSAAIPAQCPAHALAETSVPLRYRRHRQSHPRTIGRQRDNDVQPALLQIADQGSQCGGMKAQGGAVADLPGQAALYRAQPWCAGEDDDGGFHPYRRRIQGTGTPANHSARQPRLRAERRR